MPCFQVLSSCPRCASGQKSVGFVFEWFCFLFQWLLQRLQMTVDVLISYPPLTAIPLQMKLPLKSYQLSRLFFKHALQFLLVELELQDCLFLQWCLFLLVSELPSWPRYHDWLLSAWVLELESVKRHPLCLPGGQGYVYPPPQCSLYVQ